MRFLIGFGVLCSACLPGARPADAADWDACIVKSARLAVSSTPEAEPQLTIEPGAQQVLLLTSRWGAGGLIAIEHTWGSLQLELPPALAAGQRFDVQSKALRAEYSQGHSIVNYRSEQLVGSVRVLEQDDDELTLELELSATAPSVDLAKEGEIRLRGVVDAERVANRRDCD